MLFLLKSNCNYLHIKLQELYKNCFYSLFLLSCVLTALYRSLASKNTLRFVDVTSLSKILGSSLCKALPGFHVFTGCDHSPSFAFKGKVRPFTLIEKNPSAQNAFAKLGSVEMLPDSIIDEIEKMFAKCTG